MRKNIIAGNWKMHKTIQEAQDLMMSLNSFIENYPINCDIVIAPPYLYLDKAIEIFATKKIKVSAQNMSEYIEGPYTGEISGKMLHSMRVDYVILGHSERRKYFRESDEVLAKKIKIALKYEMIPIYCCGEMLEEREKGKELEVNKNQIERALFDLNPDEISKVVIAYEPIWAIGTGKTANPVQAQKVHAFIRELIKKNYSNEVANSISILYGGSVNPINAMAMFSQPDIDGSLIGGASLHQEDFMTIIKTCYQKWI